LLGFFAQIKDALCYRFPQFFKEDEDAKETLGKIFEAVQLYYAEIDDVMARP
jgi:hypothetical protein